MLSVALACFRVEQPHLQETEDKRAGHREEPCPLQKRSQFANLLRVA